MKCSLLVLSSYLDGELEARREGELEAHLVGCQRCRAGLGYLREEVERVAGLGHVHVAEHSMHTLLVQLGLIDEEESLPQRVPAAAAVGASAGDSHLAWMAEPATQALGWAVDPVTMRPPPAAEDTVDLKGGAAHEGSYWEPPEAVSTVPHAVLPEDELDPRDAEQEPPATEPAPHEAEPAATFASAPDHLSASELDQHDSTPEPLPAEPPHAVPPSMAPEPPPSVSAASSAPELAAHLASAIEPPAASQPPAAPELPPLPELPSAVPPAAPQATAAPPPTSTARPWPPPDATLPAPPSASAFPPGEPKPSDLPNHVTASGGEPEMTASPPWAPNEAPAGPTYPLTDDDVLSEPVPVERFGPPPQSKPTFFEKLRDRIAVRRALSRSSSSYDDTVQIVSGSGAPAHSGRARLEVERRRQETLRMDPGAIPGDTSEHEDKVDDLGPMPPTTQMVPPRGATRAPGMPGQMPLPGTGLGASSSEAGKHTAEETFQRPVLGVSTPPPVPPAQPAPDPLGQALSDFDRERVAGAPLSAEPRPWRPREIPEDIPERDATAHRDRPTAAAAGPATPGRRHSPSQLRESRRLLALFGGATLVMLVVGIVSGRTSTPLPTANPTSINQQPSSAAQPQHSAPSQPGAHTSSAPAAPANPAPQASAKPQPAQAPPASTAPTLTGTKVLGDSGTGYQIKDFRYGPHPGFFRVVMDFDASGAAAGTPKATIGFLDSTTLLVAVDGVIPAGSTGALPANGTVSSVSLLNPSPFSGATTYQIKLAHPVNLTASYLSGPLRLVIDLGG